MTLLAQGNEAVQRLRLALAATPSTGSIERSKAELQRHFLARQQVRTHAHPARTRLIDRTRGKLLDQLVSDDPDIASDYREYRAAVEARSKQPIPPPQPRPAHDLTPRVVAGSFEWFANPPFDVAWTSPATNLAVPQADQNAGTYSLAAQSFEQGPGGCGAGVGIYFPSPAEPTLQTFAALINYSDSWFNDANLYTGDNDLTTMLWVWDVANQDWVGQTNISPSWSSHATWFDNDGSNDSGLDGGLVQFPAGPNSTYLCWVWSSCFVNTSGSVVGSLSGVQFDAQVPYVSFSTS